MATVDCEVPRGGIGHQRVYNARHFWFASVDTGQYCNDVREQNASLAWNLFLTVSLQPWRLTTCLLLHLRAVSPLPSDSQGLR